MFTVKIIRGDYNMILRVIKVTYMLYKDLICTLVYETYDAIDAYCLKEKDIVEFNGMRYDLSDQEQWAAFTDSVETVMAIKNL